MTQRLSSARLILAASVLQLLAFGCATDPAAQTTVMGPSPIAMGTAGSAAVPPAAMAAIPGMNAMMAPAAPAAPSAGAVPPSATPTLGTPAMMPAGGAAAPAPAAEPACKYVRKNVKKLTMQEKQEWVAAVLKLKEMPSPHSSTLNWYDQFVTWHTDLQICDPSSTAPMMMGHGAPMFLPWHREHLLLFDQAIQSVSETKIATPYWDWTDPDTSMVFNDDFMGGTGDPGQNNAVMSGPFRRDAFVVKVDPPGLAGGGSAFIQRLLGSPQALPTAAEVQAALQVPNYDTAPWDLSSDPMQSFRSRLEGNGGGFAIGGGGSGCPASGVMPLPIGGRALHNAIHVWVNGTLLTAASPNDPAFWLHHNNVDRLWAKWQDMHGIDTYVPKNGEFPANNVDDPMMPFDRAGIMVTAADVADNKKLGVCFEE